MRVLLSPGSYTSHALMFIFTGRNSSTSRSVSTSNMPTPVAEPQLEVVGTNPNQVKKDVKRYGSMFKKHIERFNSHFKVIITPNFVHISCNETLVYDGPYNVETVKNLFLLSALVQHNGDKVLKAIADNSGVLPNYLAIPGDYKSTKTPETDERLLS